MQYYEMIKTSNGAPKPINRDFYFGFNDSPTIIIGNCVFKEIKSIINVDGINALSFKKNMNALPFEPQIVFTGIFKDSKGDLMFEINENEWSSPTDHWDIETKNGEISIWDKTKELVFKARKVPQKNSIEILNLNMWFHPFHIKVEKNLFMVGRFSENLKDHLYIAVAGSYKHGFCGIYLNSKELFETPVWAGLKVIGGKGLTLNGNGIWIGKGAGEMIIGNMALFKTDNVPIMNFQAIPKKILPPPNSHYFVKGKLDVTVLQFPDWIEEEYSLNGQKLLDRPFSWGPD